MAEQDYDYIFKILLIGNSDVKKSVIIHHYVDDVNAFPDNFVPTSGVDFVSLINFF